MDRIIRMKKRYNTPSISIISVNMESMIMTGSYGFTDEGQINTPTTGNSVVNDSYRLKELSSDMGRTLNSRSTMGFGDDDIMELIE